MGLRKKELADNEIQLVEQHLIKSNDPRFAEIDEAAFASKNLWNAANYILRQAYIHENRIVDWQELYAAVRQTEAYTALPRKVSNQVLIQLRRAWSSFFKALQAYTEQPDKFLGRPRLPKYKPKTKGRNILTYEQGASQILPALENALMGLKAGDSKKVDVSAQNGYGPVNPDAFLTVERSKVPEEFQELGKFIARLKPSCSSWRNCSALMVGKSVAANISRGSS